MFVKSITNCDMVNVCSDDNVDDLAKNKNGIDGSPNDIKKCNKVSHSFVQEKMLTNSRLNLYKVWK